tara:strand:+ start:1008 stop:1817 length:810 start_codon:yes stop_codon:yes gene_type:complete
MICERTSLFAAAKINLTLHVTGQRGDGYHHLDSLVVFADAGDHLYLEPAAELSLEVTGPFATGVPTDGGNLVWRAAQLAGWAGHIRLEKNLPHGAGIGSGSADAAALLRHFGAAENAADLGADVPVCLLGQAQRMQGIGEILTPIHHLPPIFSVLANPGVPVATPAVFRNLRSKTNPAMPAHLPDFKTASGFLDWLMTQRNDLEIPARRVAPVVGDVLAALKTLSPHVRMSGSGATCFALFEDRARAEQALTRLRSAQPDWWSVACGLS